MNARTILALSVPVAFVGFVVMAINSERLSEAGLAAVAALLGAIVTGLFFLKKKEQEDDEEDGGDDEEHEQQ